ncbi:LuxR C-terminal-related transcriptional regulator [Streptomyces typhae]|uniref:LuxR C-terminal-related transcriptional regulator n=1 Tax=Streptomyces typhae TaxID=2681492 RepID=UPI0018E00C6F
MEGPFLAAGRGRDADDGCAGAHGTHDRGAPAAPWGGFVGRHDEARLLLRALRAGPGLAVVRGEAGVGASRLVDEVVGRAEFAAWTQLRARCPDTDDPVPLGPLADALAALPHRSGGPGSGARGVFGSGAPCVPGSGASRDPGSGVPCVPGSGAVRDPGPGAACAPGPGAPHDSGSGLPPVAGVVGIVVPELADRLPDPPCSAAEPEVWRGLLPRAVQALLAACGDTVLVVEDVHRADPATLGLLHHLLGALPPGLRVVVTEDTAPGLPVLGLPPRTPVAEIGVRPWTPEETGEFVRRRLEADLPACLPEHVDLASLVHELSGGLPGAATALLRSGAELRRRRAEPSRLGAELPPQGADLPWNSHAALAPDADGATVAGRYVPGAGTHVPDAARQASGAGTHAPARHVPDAGMHAPDAARHASDAGRHASDAGMHVPDAGRHTPAAGTLLAAVRGAAVPPRVRREFAHRYGRLTEDARRIVDAAAVVGLAVPVEVLADVAGCEPLRAETAVEQCLRESVLRTDGACPVFRNALDHRTAMAHVPQPRQARLSLRAARALHHQHGGGPLPLADLARLYRAAGRVQEGVRCLIAAADRAAAAGDYATATSLYTRAVTEDPRARGRIRTAAKLARTAQLARAGEQVVAAVRRVLDEDDPPPRLRGEIRLHLSVVLRNQSGGALDSLNEVARAIPDLETSDPQTAARAMAVAAIPSLKGWPVDRHQHWLERCEQLGDQVEEPAARAAVAANRATALMLLGDRRAWAAAEALRPPAGTAMEAAHRTRGWTNLAHAATALGYGVRAHEFLERAAAGLADSSSPYLEGLHRTGRLVLAWHEGRWEGLHQAADLTTRHYEEIPDLTAEAMLVRGLTALHVLGDVPRARRDLTRAARVTRYDTGVILTASAAATARIHLEAGRPGQACEALEQTLNLLERTGGWVWAGEVAPTAVAALHGSEQTARARRLVAAFAAGTEDRDAPAAATALTVCRALLAEAESRPDEAVGLLSDAETEWRRLGRPFDAARAAEARGRCLLDRHREAAADGIHQVIETYRELGARWDVARCQRLLRRHDIVITHRRGRLGYGSELSPREQEVAHLVVQGQANRDIAESLVLSTRTVEHHVARIMRKLNVTSRTDIALAQTVRDIPTDAGAVSRNPNFR